MLLDGLDFFEKRGIIEMFFRGMFLDWGIVWFLGLKGEWIVLFLLIFMEWIF